MPPYPTLRVKADSQNQISTNGHNDITGGNALTDLNGVLLTSLTATCFVTVITSRNVVTFPQTQMAYTAPGVWSYFLPATAFVTGAGPWTVKVEVFDQTGTAGTLLRTFYATAQESD